MVSPTVNANFNGLSLLAI